MGSLGTSKTSQVQSSAPIGWQQAPLKDIFAAAGDAYGQAKGATAPTGFQAQFSPESLSLYQQMLGTKDQIGGAVASAGAGGEATQVGLNAFTNASGRLSNYAPTGGTASNIAAAAQYADNPYLRGMINANMRDAERAAFEKYLPQATRMAAGTGNLNSNKTAIQEGIVSRGLAEKRADIGSQLQGQIYDSGLKLAEQARQYDNESVLKAMLGQGGMGVDALKTGAAAQAAGTNSLAQLYDIANKGVAGLTTADQAALDDQMKRWQFQTSSPYEALQNYYGIVGDKNWGGTQTTNGTQTASPAAVIGGLMGSVGSLFAAPVGGTSAAGGAVNLFSKLAKG
jgi:hypothetical protein